MTSAAPTVSVIIPTHNRADLVGRAVRSVLAQTRPPQEILVVDDCSTDETAQVLAAFGEAISVSRSEVNIERGAARNRGAELASGQLVAFLDSDDEWEPTKLERQLALTPAGATSVTGVQLVDGTGAPIGEPFAPRKYAQQRLFLENGFFGSPSSLLMPRTGLRDVGGFPEDRVLQGSEDWCFLVRLTAANQQLVVIDEPLVRYRVHGDNSTGDPDALARSMWAAARWMEDCGLVPAEARARLEVRTAGVIARGYAAKRRHADAARWARRCAQPAAGPEALRALALIAASTGRGLMRRS